MRFRLYSAWGLSPGEIVQLVLILGVTFWFGVFALAGVIFLIHPFPISGEWHIPFVQTTFPLGFPFIAAAVAYLAVAFFWKKPIHLWGKDIKLPSFGMSAAQLAVSAADYVIAAACFYVLFPRGEVSYIHVLAIYLFANVVVVLSHVPGGAAVFEVIILKMSPVTHEQDVLAVIVLFRAIYYLLPLLGAAALLAYFELKLRSASFRRLLGKPKDSSDSCGKADAP